VAAKTEKFKADRPKKRGKSPNQVGAEIIANRQEALRLMPGTLPFLEDPSGMMFAYNGRYWEEMSKASLLALAFQHESGAVAKHSFRREVCDYLRAACHRREHQWATVGDGEMPCWNGVVDVVTGNVRPHRAEDYLESVLPVSFDAEERSEAFDSILETHFRDTDEDAERHNAMQAFMGYVALPHARFKKAAVLHGGPDTGKSLWALIARELVGARFTCSLPIEHMDDPIARAVLIGKRLNLLTELKAEAMIADGGFKTLVSTQEPILINAKYERPITYVPPSTSSPPTRCRGSTTRPRRRSTGC
jgi:phage/plasmid-associated DNA primase